MFYFRRQGEVSECAERSCLGFTEIFNQIAEDEFERVISFWTRAQIMNRIGESHATAAADLSRGPTQQQRLAAGFSVEGQSLCLVRLRESGVTFSELGDCGECCIFAELFEDQFLRAGTNTSAGREDRFAT